MDLPTQSCSTGCAPILPVPSEAEGSSAKDCNSSRALLHCCSLPLSALKHFPSSLVATSDFPFAEWPGFSVDPPLTHKKKAVPKASPKRSMPL
jgi:hypothetical protein